MNNEKQHGVCELCHVQEFLWRHHISYIPCKTIMVCSTCHNRIHKGTGFEHLRPRSRMVSIFYGMKKCLWKKQLRIIRGMNEKEKFLQKEMHNLDYLDRKETSYG